MAFDLPTIDPSLDIEKITTEELRRKGIVLIQKAFWTRGYYRKVSERECRLYFFLCAFMRIEDFTVHLEWGAMEDYLESNRRGVRVALRRLIRKRLISIISHRLADDRDPQKDALTIRIWRLRYGKKEKK